METLENTSCIQGQLSVLFNDPGNVNLLEYTWVQLYDIEKRIPVTVTLTELNTQGVFCIPVESALSIHACFLILRAVYKSGGDGFGLLTAKHFSDTYTDARGHKVRKFSVLASAPLAWVRMTWTSKMCRKALAYMGDTIYGHQPEMIMSNIYSDLRHFIDTTFVSTLDTVEGDTLYTREEIMCTTLSAIGAPLAFKALHEQSRLTLERVKTQGYSESFAVPEPEFAVWGSCVMWQLAQDQQSLSCKIVNQDRELSPEPTSVRWLCVRLIHQGLQVTRSSLGVSSIKHVIKTPYWAIVLSALCCGALERWSQALEQLFHALRVDPKHLCSSDTKSSELCQRCGFAYQISPLLCDPEPRRVAAVLQIDKVLLGRICTTLCTTVSEDVNSLQSRRYCLNHRREYEASPEEKWELSRSRLNVALACYGGKQESQKAKNKDGQALFQGLLQTQSETESRISASRRGDGVSRRFETQLEEDPGWWAWQKVCRSMRSKGRCWDNGTMCKHRFWDIHQCGLQFRREELERFSTSFKLWTRCSCQAIGYHIKTFPFGTGHGILNI